jgi:hypothetical protein
MLGKQPLYLVSRLSTLPGKTESLTRGFNNMKQRLLIFMVCSVMIFTATEVIFAGSRERNEAVGYIAWRYLDPNTRQHILKILGPTESLAKAASSLSRISSLHNNSYAWHYLRLPLNCASYQSCDGFTRDDDIVHVINICIRTLQGNPDPALKLSKRSALQILAHLVGDIHEPLRIGSAYIGHQDGEYLIVMDPITIREKHLLSDNGGAQLVFSNMKTLQQYWDDIILSPARIRGMGPSRFVSYLQSEGRIETEWAPVGELDTWAAQWATESLEIARDQFYKSVSIVRRHPNSSKYLIRSRDYSMRHDERLVAQQLMRAGLRLAKLLNAIYQDQPIVQSDSRQPNWRRVLTEEGPQFPRIMEDGAVSMVAFVAGNWPMVVELEEEVDIEVTIKPLDDNGVEPFVTRLRTRGSGPAKKASVQLPTSFGDNPFPAQITILPAPVAVGARDPEPFHLRGLGLGLKTDNAMFNRPDHGLVPVSYLKRNDSSLSLAAFLQSEQVEIIISPDTINTSRQGSIVFSFFPKNTFKRWAADFRSIRSEVKDGRRRSSTVWVRTDTYDEEVTAGMKIDKKWDGYDDKHKPSLGENRLIIRAWYWADTGGPSAARVADQVIKVQ